MDTKYFANDPFTGRGCAIVAACLALAGAALIMAMVVMVWRMAA